jgi:hypothetical protein
VAGDAENGAGGIELESAPVGQGLARGQKPLGDLAEFPASGRDEDDPVAVGGQSGHGAGGGDGLVVGVGVEEDGGGHGRGG